MDFLKRIVERVRAFARSNPVWASVISVAIIDSPQWIGSVWGLFTNEPLFPWVRSHVFGGGLMPAFSPYMVTVPVGVVLLAFTWYAGIKAKLKVKYGSNNGFGYSLGQ